MGRGPRSRYDLTATTFREGSEILPSASLLVIQGADRGTRCAIDQPQVRIGRGAQNDVRILDTEVSRRHATLVLGEEGYSLKDENSSNGTFVNGKPTRLHLLRNGDQIQVGRTILLYSRDSREASPAADKISLLDDQTGEDRSQIVGSLDSQAGVDLARQATSRVPPDLADSWLHTLYKISEEAVHPSVSIDNSLKRILDLTLDAVAADRGCMLVADSRTDQIEPRIVSHRKGVNVGERMPISSSIVEYVINQGNAVRTSDARHDERFDPGQSILQAGIREAMCVPMHGRYEMLGVIYVDTTIPSEQFLEAGPPPSRFNDELLSLLLAIGRQSAMAVENNRYQEALLTAERLAAVGQTIATLSHHIKNILQGVRGGSYYVEQGLETGDTELVRKGWGIVERNQDRIFNLVTDMLSFSKERQPDLQPADVNQVVGDVCDLMQVRAEEHGVTLERQLSSDIPESLFDADGMHRAVLNIVTNAIDVLEEARDGRIVVETHYDSDEEQLSIDVRDNGPGIPADELPRLFSLFESTKGARGTGLGLAVSRKILREHGGEITVESQPGEGTTFCLSWPLLTEERIRADSAEYDTITDEPVV
ncbi:MAG: FHA domain-containing protein [Planctomycetota bacterium]|nr:MAG: FHA domain-containing protein [Planctomycetota bacterium]REJ94348.1 MAG: FHA domain-containing protein [Planctomycetota bacterium]REK27296.1 MAG: FHA domain-containing protein [Planctomycetota bacterium]REK36683.1 MAG: FHA domain-containing protein [Planctomycetota bacterium]